MVVGLYADWAIPPNPRGVQYLVTAQVRSADNPTSPIHGGALVRVQDEGPSGLKAKVATTLAVYVNSRASLSYLP